ncbi:MAG: hypothetical protein HY545_00365 [Candidatus Doudnabacteria bacterium]|nr:hypothetical protein [Candidatus Doudnabacteria bacterium]
MPAFIKNFLNKITMYQLMLYFLRILIFAAAALSFFGVLKFTWWHILAQLIYLIAACWAINKIFSLTFKVKTNYESQFITAEILTLIAGPLNPLVFGNLLYLTVLSLLAMGSKYILAYKGRHIFNPAAFGVFAAALILGQGASWWVGNVYLLPVMLVGGFLILKKLRWFHLVLAFLVPHFMLVVISSGSLTVSAAIIYFAVVMLVEPLTAPAGKKLRIAYGIATAVAIFAYQNFVPDFSYSLETGLLSANLIFFLFSKSPKGAVLLVDKQTVAKNTLAFIFEPLRKFKWTAGQYLQWTLPHAHPDQRGIRRYFTIASSPTQTNIMLVTKMAVENPSTFKQTLAKMEPGSELVAGNLDGDFVLPENTAEKLAFIAGGIGITPYLSMIKYLVDQKEKRDIVLLYSANTLEEIAFKQLLGAAKDNGVRAIYKIGRIDESFIKQEVPDYLSRTFYVSGPEPMVEAFEKMLKGMRIPKIMTDFFPGYE